MSKSQDGKKDPAFVGLFVVFVVGMLFYWIAATNASFYLQYYAPWLRMQANAYSFISAYYTQESDALNKLIGYVDERQKTDKALKNIDLAKTKNYVQTHSARTTMTTSALTAIFIASSCVMLAKNQRRNRRRMLDTNENIAVATGKGVQGYLEVIEKFCGKGGDTEIVAKSVVSNPSPATLKQSFELVRCNKNVPNNLAGRQFPPMSEERLALSEVGKEKCYKRQDSKAQE